MFYINIKVDDFPNSDELSEGTKATAKKLIPNFNELLCDALKKKSADFKGDKPQIASYSVQFKNDDNVESFTCRIYCHDDKILMLPYADCQFPVIYETAISSALILAFYKWMDTGLNPEYKNDLIEALNLYDNILDTTIAQYAIRGDEIDLRNGDSKRQHEHTINSGTGKIFKILDHIICSCGLSALTNDNDNSAKELISKCRDQLSELIESLDFDPDNNLRKGFMSQHLLDLISSVRECNREIVKKI